MEEGKKNLSRIECTLCFNCFFVLMNFSSNKQISQNFRKEKSQQNKRGEEETIATVEKQNFTILNFLKEKKLLCCIEAKNFFIFSLSLNSMTKRQKELIMNLP